MLLGFKHTLLFTCFLSISLSFHASANFKTLTNFGDNPGELNVSYFQPKSETSAIVVLLHGCVQNAEALAKNSGFLALAQQSNFTLLLPQQKASNNVKSCFNWFSDLDSSKDRGEMLSIKNMILSLKSKVKAQQVYIAGLSAGGAMATAMLANYPSLFTSGAIIAGLPYPCANDLIKAISCMRAGPSQTIDELVQKARSINKKTQHWPKLLVITGTEDKVVNPKNSKDLALQWANLSTAKAESVKDLAVDHQIKSWLNSNNELQVQLIEINDIGHGMSVNPLIKHGGVEGDFLLKSSISSAISVVDFWGL